MCIQLGLFSDKKYTWQNVVLPKEKPDKVGARLEHLSCISSVQLVQQTQVLTVTAWRAIKKLHLLPYEIRQVQAIEVGIYDRTHFYNWFL
jgi:hypothetical protein